MPAINYRRRKKQFKFKILLIKNRVSKIFSNLLEPTLRVTATPHKTLVMPTLAAHGANLLPSSLAAKLLMRPKHSHPAFLLAIRFLKRNKRNQLLKLLTSQLLLKPSLKTS